MKRLGRTSAVAVGAALAVLLLAAPASAHYVSVTHGSDEGWVSSNHWTIGACDREADGNGVRTEYRTGGGGFDHVGDANGSAAGCGSEIVYDLTYVTAIRVCEANSGCSAWRAA
jgi:hypothetical protein